MTWVVKIGGSLQSSPHLRDWLTLLAEEGGGRIVIVPGGGEFADRVRATQAGLGFDDATAHRLAMQGMEEYAKVLAGMEPRLAFAATEVQIQECLAADRVPVWLPLQMAGHAPEIPQDWSVTSDSLALWLARRLNAEALVLVKSVQLPEFKDVAELAAAGYIDAAFASFLRGYRGIATCLAVDQLDEIAALLRSGRVPGRKRLVSFASSPKECPPVVTGSLTRTCS